MPVPFIMPKFDMDQEKSVIVSWLKKEGDRVEFDEVVLVVETEKVAIDVPAPASGILAGICAHEGDTVPVTEIIAYILKDGETLLKTNRLQKNDESVIEEKSISATPVAARMAQNLGVDLSQVTTSKSRITKEDVENFLSLPAAENEFGKIPATPAARRLSREKMVDLNQLTGSGPRGRIQAADVPSRSSQEDAFDKAIYHDISVERKAAILPLAGMRKTIAEKMQFSFQEAPHIALSVEVDVTELENARAHLNIIAEKRGDIKISMTALIVRITAWALKHHPLINSSLINQQIFQWEEINIGVAVGLKDGLIVPVIHNADQKTFHAIAASLSDISFRAKDGKLKLPDVQNGTFTISNLGMFGIQQFRAVINPPESAILAVGSVIRKPVVINDQDEVSVRPIMSLTLSADHRIIDGIAAANFLGDLVQAIKIPEIILY
jgi:pyruvate dehydrogenase E2 component (dihydrolipoamide acetyltransferase)